MLHLVSEINYLLLSVDIIPVVPSLTHLFLYACYILFLCWFAIPTEDSLLPSGMTQEVFGFWTVSSKLYRFFVFLVFSLF